MRVDDALAVAQAVADASGWVAVPWEQLLVDLIALEPSTYLIRQEPIRYVSRGRFLDVGLSRLSSRCLMCPRSQSSRLARPGEDHSRSGPDTMRYLSLRSSSPPNGYGVTPYLEHQAR